MNAVGVYIFQGAFTVGVAERFKVLAHLEDGDFGVATTKLNFPDLPIYTVVEEWPLEELAGRVDFLFGNPPCAPFSPIGARLGKNKKAAGGAWRMDPRLKCWDNLVRVVEAVKPGVFVGESVPGFYTNGWELSSSYARRLLDMGYTVYFVLHDVKFLGGAQQRRRVFLVGSTVELDWPTPTHVPVTFRTAVEGLDDPGPYKETYDEVTEMLHVVPQGASLKPHFNSYYPESTRTEYKFHRPRFTVHRVSMDEPTGTVFGTVMLHPTEARFLGLNELGRLMGYPDGYLWEYDDPAKATNVMVKAVTPFAARYAAGVVYEGLTRGKQVTIPRVVEVIRWSKSRRITNYDLLVQDVDITDRLLGER